VPFAHRDMAGVEAALTTLSSGLQHDPDRPAHVLLSEVAEV
jgi:hypothetical protein